MSLSLYTCCTLPILPKVWKQQHIEVCSIRSILQLIQSNTYRKHCFWPFSMATLECLHMIYVWWNLHQVTNLQRVFTKLLVPWLYLKQNYKLTSNLGSFGELAALLADVESTPLTFVSTAGLNVHLIICAGVKKVTIMK